MITGEKLIDLFSNKMNFRIFNPSLPVTSFLHINNILEVPITDVTYPVVRTTDSVDGTILYTVPSGKQAIVSGALVCSSAACNVHIDYSVNGEVVSTDEITFAGADRLSSTGLNAPVILQTGDTATLRTSSANASPRMLIMQFNPVTGLSSSALGSLSAGDNTLYTVPLNKKAYLCSINSGSLSTSFMTYANYSGDARAVNMQIVPYGTSPGSSNMIAKNSTFPDGANMTPFCAYGFPLNSGDYVLVNTSVSTATQNAWVNYYEYN